MKLQSLLTQLLPSYQNPALILHMPQHSPAQLHAQPNHQRNPMLPPDFIVTTSKQDSTTTRSGDNISRLAELEFSLQSIQSERTSMQSDHHILRDDFQKVMDGVLQHSKEIQSMHSDVRSLSVMILEIRNAQVFFPSMRISDDIS
jgi:hypothetical protein